MTKEEELKDFKKAIMVAMDALTKIIYECETAGECGDTATKAIAEMADILDKK